MSVVHISVLLEEVVKYLEGIDPSVYHKHERKFDK